MKYRDSSMNETFVAWGGSLLVGASCFISRNCSARQRYSVAPGTSARRFALAGV
jgi:hypothetical protein